MFVRTLVGSGLWPGVVLDTDRVRDRVMGWPHGENGTGLMVILNETSPYLGQHHRSVRVCGVIECMSSHCSPSSASRVVGAEVNSEVRAEGDISDGRKIENIGAEVKVLALVSS